MAMFAIDDGILERANKCRNDHSCLEGGDICRVDFLDEAGGPLFIECKEPKDCVFKKFMNSAVCECPVRKEIYRKYGV